MDGCKPSLANGYSSLWCICSSANPALFSKIGSPSTRSGAPRQNFQNKTHRHNKDSRSCSVLDNDNLNWAVLAGHAVPMKEIGPCVPVVSLRCCADADGESWRMEEKTSARGDEKAAAPRKKIRLAIFRFSRSYPLWMDGPICFSTGRYWYPRYQLLDGSNPPVYKFHISKMWIV